MTNVLKSLSCIAFLLWFQQCFSQQDREKILANFDYFTYYPDSTVKSVSKRQFTVDWFTIEFNVTGIPIAMGNTENGEKVGKWIYSDGSSRLFPQLRGVSENTVVFKPNDPSDHRTEALKPRYEAEVIKAKEEFQKKYQSLLNP